MGIDKILIVAAGGALGAIARYWLGGVINARWPMHFPLGTFLINLTGSFIIGFFLTFLEQHSPTHANWRLLVAVGFVGAYTTFSTFEFETLKLLETGQALIAALYVASSVLVGFLAVWLGVSLARKLFLPH